MSSDEHGKSCFCVTCVVSLSNRVDELELDRERLHTLIGEKALRAAGLYGTEMMLLRQRAINAEQRLKEACKLLEKAYNGDGIWGESGAFLSRERKILADQQPIPTYDVCACGVCVRSDGEHSCS